jgi:hypothetical protein
MNFPDEHVTWENGTHLENEVRIADIFARRFGVHWQKVDDDYDLRFYRNREWRALAEVKCRRDPQAKYPPGLTIDKAKLDRLCVRAQRAGKPALLIVEWPDAGIGWLNLIGMLPSFPSHWQRSRTRDEKPDLVYLISYGRFKYLQTFH